MEGVTGMREVSAARVTDAVRDLCLQAGRRLPSDVLAAMRDACGRERSSVGRACLQDCVRNAELAARENLPICQDTGLAVVFVSVGQDVHVQGDLRAAIDEGVRRGYAEGYFRASALSPLERVNTKDNTPAFIHFDIVPGDGLHIDLLPKGFGSENMARMHMLLPAQGEAGVEDAIVETVRLAGGNPCPPVVVGVGIGGTFEHAAALARRAFLRPLGESSPDARLAALEARALARINALGIGAQGLGGDTTALAVHALHAPTHIASLPVAVNLCCHALRHASLDL